MITIKHAGIFVFIAILLSVCISCEKIETWNSTNNPHKELSLTTKSIEYVKDGNAFTFNLINRVDAATEGDYIISPLSVQFLLGMLLDGARGQTADEISNVLGYGAGEVSAVNDYCLSILQQLPDLDKQTKLEIANAIVVNQKYPLLDSYKTNVSKYFEAEVENMDFSDKARTVKIINNWCSKHTDGLIPEIIKDVDPYSLAILMNAMYFKSQWAEGFKFAEGNTKPELFNPENGGQKYVKMMKNKSNILCQGNDVFTAVSLPYGNKAYHMVVLLPDEGYVLKDVTESLKSMVWSDFFHSMVSCDVDLWIPKFETKFSIKLNDILSTMGMPAAFDKNSANFKAMSEYALHLSEVRQDASIKVDEEGTVAAVVSHGEVEGTWAMIPKDRVVFHADRPFLYLITENTTGAVIFAGRYSGF